jgi:hypothetical protein
MPRPLRHALAALTLAAATLTAGAARAQSSTVDQVNEAFRAPALGIGGPAITPPSRRTQQGLSPLDALDDTRGLDGQDGPSVEGRTVHPTIAQLRGALWYWLDETERRRLMTVDAARTSGADTPTLQLFLADRAVRRFAPMALAVLSRRAEAIALRGSGAIRTVTAADAVVRMPVVARVLRRREQVATATAASFARRMERLGPAITPGNPSEDDRQHAADRAVVAAAEAARTRDAAEVALTIAETGIAYGGRAERSVVVDEAIHLLEELVAVARGTPAVERPLPSLPVSIDPDANDLPTGAPAHASRGARATGSHAERTTTGRSRGTAPRGASMVRRAGPDARCYDDFRCFQDEH